MKLLRYFLPALLGGAVFTSTASAWGWWWVAAVATGATVCVLTGGIGVPVVAGIVVGVAGTAAVGDSVYDDIVHAAASPVTGPLIYERADPLPNVMVPIVDAGSPTALIDALNSGRQHFADALQWARGIRESTRRYFGASLAGDLAAMHLQAQYVAEFLALEEHASQLGVAAYQTYVAGLATVIVPGPDTYTTEFEYKHFRREVAQNGLPTCVQDELNQLNASPAEVAGVLAFIMATKDAEASAFFAQHPASGAYVVDMLGEAIVQWQARPFASAIPPEIPVPVGIRYCGSTPNSTSNEGRLTAVGSPDIALNDLALTAWHLPPSAMGFALASRSAGFTPHPGGGDGILCVGAPIGRAVGGVVFDTGPNGLASVVVDVASLPQPAGPVAALPGETWYFQAWHRDSTAGGSNLTEGILVTFR